MDAPAIETHGTMGLKGTLATIGNASAMALLAVVMFFALWQVQAMHREGMATLREMIDRERSETGRIIEKNTDAINNLAAEFRALRMGKL